LKFGFLEAGDLTWVIREHFMHSQASVR
jgi:hypothetical protein